MSECKCTRCEIDKQADQNKDTYLKNIPIAAPIMMKESLTNGWIKVSDRLPPLCEDILAYARGYGEPDFKIIKCSYYDKFANVRKKPNFKFHEECGCSGHEYDPMMIDEVTHWMPLPKPPEA